MTQKKSTEKIESSEGFSIFEGVSGLASGVINTGKNIVFGVINTGKQVSCDTITQLEDAMECNGGESAICDVLKSSKDFVCK